MVWGLGSRVHGSRWRIDGWGLGLRVYVETPDPPTYSVPGRAKG
jgi:hypothetical protein